METENKKPSNQFAFAMIYAQGEYSQEGMTLRDYFAAKAMQGMIQNESFLKICAAKSEVLGLNWEDIISDNAYGLSDSMLKQREL